MKTKISILLVIFFFLNSYSKNDNIDTVKTKIEIPKSNVITLNLINKTNETEKFNWEKNMPWVAALLIGLLTVIANILISRQSRNTSLKAINLQLNNAKELSLAQISNSKETSKIEFNKTVLSGNRQAWINDIRDIISTIISKLFSYSLQKRMTHNELQEIHYLITKAQLMLNPEKDLEFTKRLNNLYKCTIEINSGEKQFSDLNEFEFQLREITHTTLKTEWERVKKGE